MNIKMGHVPHSELPLLPDVLNASRFRASTLDVRLFLCGSETFLRLGKAVQILAAQPEVTSRQWIPGSL